MESACTLAAGITAVDAAALYTSTGDPITKFDVIQIDSERLVVIFVDTGNNSLLIGRGYGGTTAAIHAIAAPILRWGSV